MTSWIDIPAGSGFGPDALPYGSFSADGLTRPHVGVAIGDQVLDLTEVSRVLLPERAGLFAEGTLDRLSAQGRGSGTSYGERSRRGSATTGIAPTSNPRCAARPI